MRDKKIIIGKMSISMNTYYNDETERYDFCDSEVVSRAHDPIMTSLTELTTSDPLLLCH